MALNILPREKDLRILYQKRAVKGRIFIVSS